MNTQTHIPSTVAEFVEACKTLDNTGNQPGIYELFEDTISDELRCELYAYGRPLADTHAQAEAGTHTWEPCRDAMYELGMLYNVQSLIDY